ncbi:MAG: trigger factor [Candidatus Omnitrophota bacterium]
MEIKIEVKKADGNKREISVEVSGDVVKNKFDNVFKRIAKEAKIPGFRPGNAPRDLLEKNYASDANQLVLKELIPDIYNQAIEKEGLDVIDLPDISEVKLERHKLSFKAAVEISPQLVLSKYKGIKVGYKKVEVSSDEVKRSLNSLKESRKAEVLDDNFARSLSYPDLAALEDSITRQIFLEKDNQQRQEIEGKIIEAITKDLNFKLPDSLVNRQLQDLLRQAKLDMALKGLPKEKIQEQESVLSGQLEPEARKQVKVYLVLAEIAKKENIPVDDHMPRKVVEFLLKEADWQFSS